MSTDFKDRLYKLRNGTLGLTFKELSQALQISVISIKSYEKGNRFPLVGALARFHKAFSINLNWLVTGEGGVFADGKKNLANFNLSLVQQKTLRPILLDPALGKRMKSFRKMLSMDLKEFAEVLGLNLTDIRDFEEARKSPKFLILKRLYDRHQSNLNWLIVGEEEPFFNSQK